MLRRSLLLIYLLLGKGDLEIIEIVSFGKLFAIMLCGVFGGRRIGMLEVLRTSKETFWIPNCSF